jgi:tetratricopeptide (TPR) repeat protein
MKKLVLASVVALASMSFVFAPTLKAQDQGQITIKDPAEYNAYQMFSTQTDPKAKAAAGESFLEKYPQSVVKNAVLDALIDAYQATGDQEKQLNAATRLLQVDPNSLKAILFSVLIKKGQCAQKSDPATCDDAAALAQKGLSATKPAATSEDDWKKLTSAAFPIFHSAVGLDDALSKKDYKGAQDEYTTELKLYSDDQAKSVGLVDTLQLAQAYAQPGAGQDLVKAVWYFARVWDLAPPQYKAQIEPKLEYYYKKYHGALDGLDAIKQQAQASTFPPGTLNITAAKSPAEQIHDLVAATPDLNTLALADKETVLALGSKEDADKLWALLKDKATQVPGVVISAEASVIKVAVTQDAKDAKVADFVVNLKKPLTDAELKVVIPGFEFKTQPAAELVGTYDSFTQTPATATTAQAAVIVLREGEFIPEKKKAAPAHHPAGGAHRPTHK